MGLEAVRWHKSQALNRVSFSCCRSRWYAASTCVPTVCNLFPFSRAIFNETRSIGDRGYFFFLIFQCFMNRMCFPSRYHLLLMRSADLDGLSDAPGKHVFQSTIFGQMGPYIRQPSHSFLVNMGPQVALLLLDCRAERKKDQVCSPAQYDRVFQRIQTLPPSVEHLVILLGIPIAYPRMVFLESALESKLNPLVALGRNGSLGLSGFVNKFNADAELLDDLNDHWTARMHKVCILSFAWTDTDFAGFIAGTQLANWTAPGYRQ